MQIVVKSSIDVIFFGRRLPILTSFLPFGAEKDVLVLRIDSQQGLDWAISVRINIIKNK